MLEKNFLVWKREKEVNVPLKKGQEQRQGPCVVKSGSEEWGEVSSRTLSYTLLCEYSSPTWLPIACEMISSTRTSTGAEWRGRCSCSHTFHHSESQDRRRTAPVSPSRRSPVKGSSFPRTRPQGPSPRRAGAASPRKRIYRSCQHP